MRLHCTPPPPLKHTARPVFIGGTKQNRTFVYSSLPFSTLLGSLCAGLFSQLFSFSGAALIATRSVWPLFTMTIFGCGGIPALCFYTLVC